MPQESTELEGRVAVVTGAGRGIGRAVARALADRGARVVVNDIARDPEGAALAERVAREISDAGGTASANLDSIVDYRASGRLVAQAVEEFGSADILVNNAGLSARGAVWEIDDVEFERVTAAHIAGSFNCTRHASLVMRERGFGRIVNLVSRAGLLGIPDSQAYGMAKGAVFGLTNGASRDLAPFGITVNGVCPAATRTAMVEDAVASLRAQGGDSARRAERLLEGMQTPEEVARPIAALCTAAAGSINGQFFLIEGNRIGLFQPMAVTQHVERSEAWSATQLGEALAGLELHSLSEPYAAEPG